MGSLQEYFINNYSFITYIYIVSKLEKLNKKINDKIDQISPLYDENTKINNKIIEKIINEDFLDYKQMECVSLFLEYYLNYTKKYESLTKKRYEFLSYFTDNIDNIIKNFNYKDIGGAEGYIVFSDFFNSKQKLVIKTPKENEQDRFLLFEYYIGYNFINKLRKKVPNFMYTYGIFMCNDLLEKSNLLSDKMVLTKNFCKDKDKNNIYVLFEKIDGITFDEYIKQISKPEDLDSVINIILQLMFTLEIAQQEGEYVHNDLHTSNVMIRKLNKPIVHEYIINNLKYKLKMNSIATIIDFGYNRFVENGIPLGTVTFNDLHIYPFTNFTSNDVYKLIMWTITGLNYLYKLNHKNNKFVDKITEVIDFLISFFKNKHDYFDTIKNWNNYINNKSQKINNHVNFLQFYKSILENKDTFFSPVPYVLEFANTVTPSNYIEHIRFHYNNIWSQHVSETELTQNDYYISYIRPFYPLFNDLEYKDYTFYKSYNDIYMSNYVQQKQTLYNIFNKEYKLEFNHDCLLNQHSFILNNNSIIDNKHILDLFKSNKKEYEILNEFENINIKNVNEYYQNDVNTLLFYLNKMKDLDNSINNVLLSQFINSTLDVSMDLFSDSMKNEIKKLNDYLDIFQKYILLITYSIDLHDLYKTHIKSHEFPISNFYIDSSIFKRAILFTFYFNKYYSLINKYYSNKLLYQISSKNIYSFYNLITILQNNNPYLKHIYSTYIKCFIKYKVDNNFISNDHYVSVNSNSQFSQYFKINSFDQQIIPIMSLLSRFVNMNEHQFKQILNFDSNNNTNMLDIDIYNQLRNKRIIKDSFKKLNRNKKRGKEVYDFILKFANLKNNFNNYYHLDYGGNDGAVASEISSLLSNYNLKKENVYSADIEKWLGNVKNNNFNNITYTLLDENKKLPYNDNSFNSISCLQVLHHLEFMENYIKEFNRILKPNGILIVREHDCNDTSTQLLIDIEHMIHEYVEPDIPNTDILNSYCAFYISSQKLDTIMNMKGFNLIHSQKKFNNFNPTRYYYSIYQKVLNI